MPTSTFRNAMMTGLLAAALLAVPTQGLACDWLFGGWGARTTYSAPAWGTACDTSCPPVYVNLPSSNTCAPCNTVPQANTTFYGGSNCSSCVSRPTTAYYSGSSCNSCTPQGTTSYYAASSCNGCTTPTASPMVQTAYRTVYRAVPVTTYQPYTRTALLTGLPVTSYRPVIAWTYQAQTVPVTSYYANYANSCGTTGTCAAVSGGCATCMTNSTTSGASDGEGLPYPSLNEASPGPEPTPQTFREESGTSIDANKPIPDPETTSIPGPDLRDPSSRTTSRPLYQAVHYVQTEAVPSNPQPIVDDGGWSISVD